MMKPFRLLGVLCIVSLTASSAFAGELAKPEEKLARTDQIERAVAPLLYLLPDLGSTRSASMEIRILQGHRQLVGETVSLPASLSEGAAIDVLLTHPEELKRLRSIEAETPGSLRFLSFLGDRLITDEPFAAIEERGAGVSLLSAVGEIQKVEVRPAPRLRVGTQQKDPACVAACDMDYQNCLDWCDPRGTSCEMCWTNYVSCYNSCPGACTEPASVTTYQVWTPGSYLYTGTNACLSYSHPTTVGTRWEYRRVKYTVRTYQRTVHCDGTYTDVLTSQYTTNIWCWWQLPTTCGPTTGQPFGACTQ